MLTHLRKVVLATLVGLAIVPAQAQVSGARCKEHLTPIYNIFFNADRQFQTQRNTLSGRIIDIARVDLTNIAMLSASSTQTQHEKNYIALAKSTLQKCKNYCEGLSIDPEYDGNSTIQCAKLGNKDPNDLRWYREMIDEDEVVAQQKPVQNQDPECLFNEDPNSHCNRPPAQPPIANNQPEVVPVIPSYQNNGQSSKSLEEIYQEDANRMRQQLYKENEQEESAI